MTKRKILIKSIWILLGILCFFPFVSPGLALFMGLVLAFTINNPFLKVMSSFSGKILKYSVVGLGFSMNAFQSLAAGCEGMVLTIASVSLTMIFGMVIGIILKVSKPTAYMVSSGTAICGGSAIAAVAPVTGAKKEEISMALGTIFLLNAIALFVFPPIGEFLELSEKQFGYWAAIAIHDTSSVVGASSVYGNHSLEIATLVKLTRALWIIPLVLVTRLIFKKNTEKKFIPYFIFFFILAMFLNTIFIEYLKLPYWSEISTGISAIAKRTLVLSLFFIGGTLNFSSIRQVGVRPFLQGFVLWIVVSLSSLFFVYQML